MLEQWERAGWLDERLGISVFTPLVALLAELLVHVSADYVREGCEPYVIQLVREVDHLLSFGLLGSKKESWILGGLSRSEDRSQQALSLMFCSPLDECPLLVRY